MRLGDLPVVGPLLEGHTADPVFDAFIVLGPLLILFIALQGRTRVTTLLASGYLIGFVGYTLVKGIRSRR
ncbi:MAG: hypothetical protein ABEJ58_05685 [Halodesulfurarchaeum sp.]